jgi:hypothetical protein
MKRVFFIGGALLIPLLSGIIGLQPASAAEPQGNFAIQVTPSPLVTTVKPGESKTLELKVHNSSTASEQLVIEPRSFKIDGATGEVKLDTDTPPEIASWLSFSESTFTLKAGEWRTLKVNIDVPKDAGFSYYFSLMIRRANEAGNSAPGRQIKGSVAVFTLINVDRPGAIRKIELLDVKAEQTVYEYLPAELKLTFKNTGNTILQPYGNIFIQRKSTDQSPLGTLSVNDKKGYLLPGTERTMIASWNDGFPHYETSTSTDGKTVKSLKWNIDRISHFRIGKYTAKVVAVYNDGQRDVPVEKAVTFWVIPWRAIGSFILAVIGIVLLSRFLIKRKTEKAVRKALASRKTEE